MKHWRQYLAELIGTAALLCAVIGSGIMAEDLSDGNIAVALIANTLATVFALYVLIEAIGPLSGAHFNPAVSLVMAYRKDLPRELLIGEVFGFDEPVGGNAIEVHVTRLRGKLAPDGPAIRTVRGVGYLLDAG